MKKSVVLFVLLTVFVINIICFISATLPESYHNWGFAWGNGTYNSTFIQDLGTNPTNLTIGSDNTRTNISNNLILYKSNSASGIISTQIPSIYTNDTSQVVIEFYWDILHQPIQTFFMQGGSYYNSSNMSVGLLRVYTNAVQDYLTLYSASGVSLTYSLSSHKQTQNHLALLFEGNNVSLFMNGYYMGSSKSDLVSYYGIRMTPLPMYIATYSNVQYGPIKYYVSDGSITNEDLTNLTSQFFSSLSYPSVNNLVYQRNLTTNKSDVFVSGTTGTPSLEVNLNLTSLTGNNNYSIAVNASESFWNYTFLNVDQGIYNLSVFFSNDPIPISKTLGVGDVILISGQSNSIQGGDEWNYSNVGYDLETDYFVSATINTVDTISFKENFANKSDSSTWAQGMAFAPLAYEVSNRKGIPVMLAFMSSGGQAISCWDINQSCYNSTKSLRDSYIYGGKVNFVIWMQGESDSSNPNYEEDLLNMTRDLWLEYFDFQTENKYILIPPGYYVTSGEYNNPCLAKTSTLYSIQQQYNLINSNNSYLLGAALYDLHTWNNSGCVHMDNISYESYPYAMRVAYNSLYYIYGYDLFKRPELINISFYNDTAIIMKFNKNITIADFLGNSASTAKGFRLYNSTGLWNRAPSINDTNVLSTSISNGSFLLVQFNQNISGAVQYSYCSHSQDCYGQDVIRTSESSFPYQPPTPIIFPSSFSTSNQLICEFDGNYWYYSSCHSTPLSDSNDNLDSSTIISPGGIRTFKPSEDDLKNGYSKNLKPKDKVEFSVNNEQKTVVVKKVDSENKEVVVSVSGNDYAIKENSSVKIDTDNDGYYDTEISVNSITGNYANIKFKSIYEEIPKQEQEEKESPVGEIQFSKIKWYYYVIVGVVVLLILGYFIFRKVEKRKK